MSFWNRTIEFKSLIISLVVTVVMFLATMFLFWCGHPEIVFALLTSGGIVTLSWLVVYLYKRKHPEPKIRLDIVFIYIRLSLIVITAIIFAVLQLTLSLVIISPIFIIVGYFAISMFNLIALIRKDQNV